MAFPAISTGAFGYPRSGAAAVAVSAVADHLTAADLPQRVVLCCFDDEAAGYINDAIADLGRSA